MKKILIFGLATILTFGTAIAVRAAGQIPGDDDEGKTTICHIPPGNPENQHTISVSENAVSAHLNHGDTLGDC